MAWRVGLVDSLGLLPGTRAARRFVRTEAGVEPVDPVADASGHGTRIAEVIGASGAVEWVLAQVLDDLGRTSADVVAAAVDWCVSEGCDLIHLSLGLAADRSSLAEAIGRAVAHGGLVVASVPARGAVPYPAAYPGVIRATGDARCAPGELSQLGPGTFGGCPRLAGREGGGASIGAAHVTAVLVAQGSPGERQRALDGLSRVARYQGPEQRGRD
jgi:hypothetical protein